MQVKSEAGRHQGRSFIITGAGSGIGEASARRLAEEGAAITLADVRIELAQAVAASILAAGGRAQAVVCDVAREEDVAAMVAAHVTAFGPPDGLYANAGTAGRGWIHELPLQEWERIISINLTGPFLCAKHVLPHFLERGGGVFLSTGSIASLVIGGGGSAASYAASKGGILQLTRQVAVDYGDRGIRAVCICPGAVETNIGRHGQEERLRLSVSNAPPLPRSRFRTPLPRAAAPAEIAAAASFLFSDDAAFITGCAFMVDGGLTAI
jgi:NAD(P)-dependent dehydrogenase (short-subunit alcohol dehydrogenase family)